MFNILTTITTVETESFSGGTYVVAGLWTEVCNCTFALSCLHDTDHEIRDRGVKISAGTDATRVASYNPWVALAWMVTGKTVAGLQIYP